MARFEDPPSSVTNQDSVRGPRRQPARRPRRRRCLMKGCGRRFRPERPLTRYCGEACRTEARRWSRWKAQQIYRATDEGKAKRQAQCQQRRNRIKAGKAQQARRLTSARVITSKTFFRSYLRPARMLRDLRPDAPIATTTVLLPQLSASPGARTGAGAALARARRRPPRQTATQRQREPSSVRSRRPLGGAR